MIAWFVLIFSLSSIAAAVAGLAFLYFQLCHDTVKAFFSARFLKIAEKFLRERRLKKIDLQIVDGVDMLMNGLKAGLSLSQAFALLAEDSPAPLSEEFALIVGQIKIGKNIDDALLEWKERTPLDDIHLLVEAILTLRQTGGNLVETFSTIAETIRERQKVSGKIRVITAQGVFQAATLLALAPLLTLGIHLLAGWYIRPLFATPLGWLLVGVSLGLQLTGALWLRKIVRIRV